MRYRVSTLKREVQQLKESNDIGNAPIVLNLENGKTYSIRSKEICRFGCAALFDEGSAECEIVKQAVEPKNKMIQLLQMCLN